MAGNLEMGSGVEREMQRIANGTTRSTPERSPRLLQHVAQ